MHVKLSPYVRKIADAMRSFVRARKLWAPRRAKIAVLHGSNVSALAPLFRQQPYEVVHLEGEAIYVDPQILLSALRHVIQMRNVAAGYAMAVLERIRPAIVVTNDDNSTPFQMVARRLGAVRFLAIQNGSRQLERDHPVGRSPQIYLREFACLGQYEIDQFSRHGARVGKYYPIGSLKDSYYRAARVKGAAVTKEFDLCLVSQFRPGARFKYSERLDSFEVLTQHVRRFCESHHTTVCVPFRFNVDPAAREWERDFFETRLGALAKLCPNVPGEYTTYGLVDRSRVSIGMHTTVLREGFGRGNRVLSCNYTGDPVYNFPVPGPWFLDDPAYEMFEQKLLWLLAASEEEYKRACGDAPSYVVGYDDNMPTHVFLQNVIADAVRGSAEPTQDEETNGVR